MQFRTAAAHLLFPLALFALPAAAHSQDWSGFYAGVDVGTTGGRNGELKASLDPARDARLTYDIAPLNARFDRERNIDRQGSGAMRVGRLWQARSLVWGAEIRAGIVDLNETFVIGPVRDISAHSNSVPNLGAINNSTDTLTARFELEAVGSIRARIGVPVGDRFLASAFAGPAVALGRLSASQTSQIIITRSIFTPGSAHFNTITTVVERATSGPEESRAMVGATVGGAIDYRMSDDWLLHAEAGLTFYHDIEAASGGLGGSSGGDSRISYAPTLYAVSLGATRRF